MEYYKKSYIQNSTRSKMKQQELKFQSTKGGPCKVFHYENAPNNENLNSVENLVSLIWEIYYEIMKLPKNCSRQIPQFSSLNTRKGITWSFSLSKFTFSSLSQTL